jgi:hypothetical protein
MAAKTKKAAPAKIAVGTASKYKKVNFDVSAIIRLYKSGKPVSQIALAIGYPANTGQNRVRRVLLAAGVYKRSA